MKEARVREGRAHASLVFDGPNAVGWCQFGPTAELPNIRSRRSYEEGLAELPDWRITCFFIDRERRGKGSRSLPSARPYSRSLDSEGEPSRRTPRMWRVGRSLAPFYAAGPSECSRSKASRRHGR